MADEMLTGFLAGQADGNNNGCNNGWGGDGSWIWILVIFALLGYGNGGWGGFGGNGGSSGYQGALTRGDLCQDMNFNNLDSAVRSLQSGLCDGFYAMNTGMLNGFNNVGNAICNLGYEQAQLTNGVNMNMMQGFNSANIVALQNQNALQAQLSQCLKKIFNKAKEIFCINFNAVGTCMA